IRDNKPDVLVALESESAELTSLVRLHGERYGFAEAEHAEALAAALADPVDALTCFRAMAAEVAKPGIRAAMAIPPITASASGTA
ncbi:MAG: hypothetical protein ACYCZR_13210, partial [Burkholderiales bacterium]